LTHCDLGSSPEILSVILQSDVKGINLSNNNIDSLGAIKIAEYLEVDPPIEMMSLGHNRLNDDDVILIAQALKRNTNLGFLNLEGNKLTSIGVKALLTCVFDKSSLNAISESNHRLEELNILSEGILPETGNYIAFPNNKKLQGYIDKILELYWTEKVLLVLQDKDSLLQYLANVPVELIPDVLEFSNYQLNIVYCTMRWWNMPMLYSYHNCVKSDAKRKR
jgi:hypothetical protein